MLFSKTKYRHIALTALALCTLLVYLPASVAAPVSESQVRAAADAWVKDGSGTMGEDTGTHISGIKHYQGGISGSAGYYLVTFAPNGWALFPADDQYWPVPTFSKGNMTPELFEETL